MNNRFSKSGMIFLLLLVSAFSAQAQLECRSQLAGHLKPVSDKIPLEWAVELTLSPGIMSDRFIYNGMLFSGLNYSAGAHQFYLEGGLKYWRNQQTEPTELVTDNGRPGLRELFYQWRGNSTSSVTVGLQSFQSDDLFLVNERVWGLNYQQQLQKWDLQVAGGTVTRDFSRNGIFCSVCYLYDIIPDRKRLVPGQGFGDTNFASVILSWTPGRKPVTTKSAEDEFLPLDVDEFDEFSTFEDPKKSPLISLEKTGLIFYHELDEIKNEKPIHVGGFATIQLPADLTLGTEILYQSMPDNNIVLGMFYLEQQFSWKPGPVDWRAAYWAQNEILAEATPKISFSNIFAGEILRLDLVELPLFQFSVKQRFPRWRMNTTIQYAASTAASNMQEIDFAIGKRFRNHVKLTGLFGRVTADALADPVHLARLELRLFY